MVNSLTLFLDSILEPIVLRQSIVEELNHERRAPINLTKNAVYWSLGEKDRKRPLRKLLCGIGGSHMARYYILP
eukprot:scaffold2747_cov104-Cylindrotheca_fusiformis.AAC.14